MKRAGRKQEHISEATRRSAEPVALLRARLLASLAVFFCGALSCARGHQVPSPELARDAYVRAIHEKDVAFLRAMLTESSQSEWSEDELTELLERDAAELEEHARELASLKAKARAEATVFLIRGRVAALALEDGTFKVTSTGIVPRRPTTPEAAVEGLRDAVLARDYHGIEQTLSASARAQFSEAFQQLGESLSELDTAVVDVREDHATIEFLDGRVITLSREGAVWRIEELK